MLLYVDVQYASPYALSAFVALQEKGLPFTVETLDLAAGDQLRPDFARLSISARVPTLVDGDFALSESSAIAEYLDEVCPRPALYPSVPRARARARQVQAWLRSDFLPIRNERSTEVIFYGPTAQPLSAAAEHSAARLFAAAGELLAHGGDNLCGNAWCIADVDLALMLNRLLLNGDAVPDALARYATRQWQRPSVQSWVLRERPARAVTT